MARLRAENEQEEAELEARAEQEQREQQAAAAKKSGGVVPVDAEQLEGLDAEEQMRLLLGFAGGFGSTKGQKVEDNHSTSARGTVAKHKGRKYRQYMNRKGGFNRPLEKME